MRYIIFILIFFYPINIFASSKELIKNKLKETENISFKFIQKIWKKTERGKCIISYSKKILCKYDDINNKILVSNRRSLVINSKKIKNYLRYKLKDTPLNLILDKRFLLDKLDNIEIIKSERKASTSFLQRKLQIGYNRAARIIDQMEANGEVSKANHVGKREVLK